MKLLALLLVAACVSIGVNASCSTTAQWRSKNGRIEYNGEEFAVKGLNWWGMEDPGIGMLTGLDTNSLSTYINFMTQNKFNTLRIPISVDWVLHPNRLPNQWTVGAEPSFQGKTGFQVLDLVFAAAEAHGIAIVLDFHWFVEYNSQLGYWYSIGNCVNDKEGDCINFTEEIVNGAWDTVVKRYKSYSNFMGIDFFNEAMSATWGLGDTKTDWDLYVTRTTNAILANQPDFQGLFFVEGIADATQPSGCNLQQTWGHWWGGNLEFFKCKPLVVNDQTRIVYFPHTYGPSLYAQTYFSDPSYPANMPAVWDAHFGFLRTTTDQAVLIGEWGGVYTGATKVFQDAFATYLASKKIGNTYWAMIGRPGEINTVDGVITPTNGALNPNAGKLSMLAIAQPNPTIRTFDLTCTPSSTTGFGTTTGSTPAPATPAPSTPAPSTPAPSTPAPSTPAPSTPAPSTPAPSTPAPSTPAPSTPAPSTGACSLSVTQVKNAGWVQNGKDVTQFEVRITNNGAKTEQVVVSLASAPISFYSATNPSGSTYGLPDWFANGLPAGSTWVFGYATYGAAQTAVSFVTPSSCATGSTPAPSTPAPSTPAPSTPAPSTPAPSTPAPSTPAPSTGGQCSTVTFSQTVSNSWSDAGTVTQYALTVTNTGSKAITALTLSIGSSSSSLVQIWNAEPVAASKTDYTLPAYSYPFGVRASASIGYIVRSTSPITFQVVSMAC